MKYIKQIIAGIAMLSIALVSSCSDISDEDAYNWGYNIGAGLFGGSTIATEPPNEVILPETTTDLISEDANIDNSENNNSNFFPEYENPFLVLPFDRSSTSSEISASLKKYNNVKENIDGWLTSVTFEDVAMFGGVPVDIKNIVINEKGTIKAFTLNWARIVENSGFFGCNYEYTRNDPFWHLKVKCSLKKELMTYTSLEKALSGGLDLFGYFKDDLVTIKNGNYPEVNYLYCYFYPDFNIDVDFDGITYCFTDNNGDPIDNTKRIDLALNKLPFAVGDVIVPSETENINRIYYEANLHIENLGFFFPVSIQCYLDEESRIEKIYIEGTYLYHLNSDIISTELNQKSDNKSWKLNSGDILRFEANSLSIRPEGQINIDGGWD